MRYKPLSREEEVELARRWRNDGDWAAREKIVASYLPLGKKLAYRFKQRYLHLAKEDLEQQSVLGLLRAIEDFDPDQGNRFGTYAGWWIQSLLDEFCVRNSRLVRPSLRSETRRMQLPANAFKSLTDPVVSGNRSDTASKITLGETIPSPDPSPEDIAILSVDSDRKHLGRAMRQLDPRSRKIIKARFAEDPPALREIGEKLGISKERVRQLEAAALKQLRELLVDKEDADAGGLLLPA